MADMSQANSTRAPPLHVSEIGGVVPAKATVTTETAAQPISTRKQEKVSSSSSTQNDITIPEPQPDYIIVFDMNKKAASTGEKSDKAKEEVSLQEEFDRLTSLLNSAGLQSTSRAGKKGSNTLLVFVRASEERIEAELHRERLSDFIYGVTSVVKASPRTARDFATEPIQPAERLRLVWSILTSKRSAAAGSVTNSVSSGTVCNLFPLPSPPNFPHLTSIFPPHDHDFNKRWLKDWSQTSSLVSIPIESLDKVCQQFGEKVALYFAFLRFYTSALRFPAGLGLIWWLLGLSYSPYYSILLVTWSVVFVEMWAIKEKSLSVRWGSFNAENGEKQRGEFVGEKQKIDPVTGVQYKYFPYVTTLTRQLMAIPILVGFASILVGLLSSIYVTETLISEIYDGRFKKGLTLIPTIMFSGLVPQFIAAWTKIAEKLTLYENLPKQSEFDSSLAVKMFIMNSLVAYMPLILTAFVYVPFGSILIPRIVSLLPEKHANSVFSQSTDFSVNSGKLGAQIFAYTLTNQIVGAFLEVGMPFILHLVKGKIEERQENKAGGGVATTADELSEHAYLERVREEANLPEYTIFGDYAEMSLQFGYQTLFSVISPISPVFALANNLIELRSDAYKITAQHRRPIPRRESSIGAWLQILSFISWMAALTNSALVYLYKPSLAFKGRAAEYMSNQFNRNVTMPTNGTVPFETSNLHQAGLKSFAEIETRIAQALLIGLASGYAWLVVRNIVRSVLHRTQWIESESELAIRRRDHELKKGWLEEMELKFGPQELAKRSGKQQEAKEKDKRVFKQETESGNLAHQFWQREDLGRRELNKFKTE